jgi:glucose/arabinose dehydrogenase
VQLTHAEDDKLYVVEQPGQVKVFDTQGKAVGIFLDITDRTRASGGEQGLLGLAFHPDFKSNGRIFINYTDAQGATVVAEYQTAVDRSKADSGSERIVLRIEQPYGNHNGGQVKFGPDGYLYIGMGDGGAGGDPLNSGQDRTTLLGAMLRIDVDGEQPYAIPADNPYAQGDGRPEIWATGLRNPWRFSFDAELGDLYIGDVGQNRVEEINFQPAASKGGENYGWRVLEGNDCFAASPCAREPMTAPIATYNHDRGCSVTGGYVYRGTRISELTGSYIFGDFCTGTVWALRRDDTDWQIRTIASTNLRISSFGEGNNGELYMIDLRGTVYRLNWQ